MFPVPLGGPAGRPPRGRSAPPAEADRC